MFFFSSRRRHTRWPRDWSSDVCSSDLEESLLDQCNISDGHIHIAQQSYRVVLVEDASRLTNGTMKFLDDFKKSGGTVLFSGKDTSEHTVIRDLKHVIEPEIEIDSACKDISISLVKKEEKLFYLLV